MSTPEPMRGLAANARIQIQQAADLLVAALPALGVMSDEGRSVSSALATLQRAFGKTEAKTRELMPAEIMSMLAAMPQAGGGPAQRPGMGGAPGGPPGGGLPGGPPPGGPPGGMPGMPPPPGGAPGGLPMPPPPGGMPPPMLQ